MRSRARFAAISLLATLVLAMFAGVAMAQDDVTITVWSWRTEDEDAYNEIFDVYEEANPGVTVEFVPFVSTDYNNILATGLTGDGGPDVVQLRAYGGVQSLIDAGQLMPLDGEVDLSNFTDAILKGATGQADGRVYGVPFGVQALGAFYNVGVFEELGLTEPETWEEFTAALDTIAEAGYIPIGNPALDSWMLPILHDAVAAPRYGGPEFQEAVLAGETDFTDENYVASIAVLQDIQPYLPPDVTGVGYNDARTLFISGLSPIFIGGSFEIGFWKSEAPDIEVGMFMVPPPPESLTGPLVPSWMDGSYGVNALTDSPEESLALVEWMGTVEFGQMFTDKINQLSPVAGTEPTDPLLAEFATAMMENPAAYMLLVDFRYGDPTGTNILGPEIQSLFLGETTPEEIAQSLQDGISQWFVPAEAE
ncbi:MAG: sugar ABC transporter sugar-binding protein [Anaerolineaceae bacterium]|nr:sugar ABC transporter sugar-binding protein [Anaerolineaceae bacterium]